MERATLRVALLLWLQFGMSLTVRRILFFLDYCSYGFFVILKNFHGFFVICQNATNFADSAKISVELDIAVLFDKLA